MRRDGARDLTHADIDSMQPYPQIFDVELVELDEPWALRQMLVGVRSEAGLSKAAADFLALCVAAGGPATVRER